jgi:hypothetical protein
MFKSGEEERKKGFHLTEEDVKFEVDNNEKSSIPISTWSENKATFDVRYAIKYHM